MQLSNLKDWVVVGCFPYSSIEQLIILSNVKSNWIAVDNLEHFFTVGVPYEEHKFENDTKIDFKKADKNHCWVACKEAEKKQILQYLNDETNVFKKI